jgi:DNA-binding NarL/FixJ family response regulator
MPQTRVVVVADDSYVQNGIAAALSDDSSSLWLISRAATTGEARRMSETMKSGIFVVDTVGMCLELGEIILHTRNLEYASSMPVLLLTANENWSDMELLRLGACAMPRSRTGIPVLLGTLRLMASGYMPVRADLVRYLALGVPPVDDGAANVTHLLTAREREVFDLVAQGLSNAEIAHTLTMGTSTVKSHVQEILRKLRIRNRLGIVICAYRSMMNARMTLGRGCSERLATGTSSSTELGQAAACR